MKIRRMFIQAEFFTKVWKNLGFVDEDLRRLELTLLKNPKGGDVIKGTGRLRKLRFAFQNRGKSGSVRVCYVDFGEKEILYLFAVFAKNEQENLSQAECNILKKKNEMLEKSL